MTRTLILLNVLFLLSCNHKHHPESERTIVYIKNDTIQIPWNNEIVGYVYYDDNGKAGLLDENKKLILEPHFDYIENWLQEGVLQVDSGGYRFWEVDYGGYVFKKMGLISLNGKIIFRPQFDELYISDNSALIKVDSLFGYVDLKGNWLISPKYKYAERFEKGAAVVKNEGKFEIINKAGNKIINESFDEALGFKNGVTVVRKGEQYGFINYRGKYLLPLSNYLSIGEYNWYHGQFQAADKKYYLIDTAGYVPVKAGFDEVRVANEKDTIYAVGTSNKKKLKVIIGLNSR